MKRRLFTLCSAFSLLLCVAVCVLWAGSYRRQGWATWTHLWARGGAIAVTVGNFPGRLFFEVHSQPAQAKARTPPMPSSISWSSRCSLPPP